jgi:putative hydrolase of the HAD superfamily
MVGNNLERDIKGANRVGLLSVWFHWNDRYPDAPADATEEPTYIVHSPEEILAMVRQLTD